MRPSGLKPPSRPPGEHVLDLSDIAPWLGIEKRSAEDQDMPIIGPIFDRDPAATVCQNRSDALRSTRGLIPIATLVAGFRDRHGCRSRRRPQTCELCRSPLILSRDLLLIQGVAVALLIPLITVELGSEAHCRTTAESPASDPITGEIVPDKLASRRLPALIVAAELPVILLVRTCDGFNLPLVPLCRVGDVPDGIPPRRAVDPQLDPYPQRPRRDELRLHTRATGPIRPGARDILLRAVETLIAARVS
jgi:hypothetical protein